ncbi:MAG: type II secretion system protein [Verrucomicrobiae bacterium]|nr:type II secretion system protein [Verrucomicrobiae bacterium]
MKNIMNKKASGFSLVELLVVIAVIGLIAAIAIPQISKITDKAQKASDQRNAQNVVGVYGAAVAAGYQATGLTTDAEIIAALEGGVNGVNTFSDSLFKISALDATTEARVTGYIAIDTATPPNLTYVPAGGA